MDTNEGLAGAQVRMQQAKQKFTKAAESVLKGDSEAPLLARLALAEIEDARAELRRLHDEDVGA